MDESIDLSVLSMSMDELDAYGIDESELRKAERYVRRQKAAEAQTEAERKSVAEMLSPCAMAFYEDAFQEISWGADVAGLCKIGYNYRGHDNLRMMAIMVGPNGEKIPGSFHFTGNLQTTFCRAKGDDPLTLHVNLCTPGMNLYYCPQVFKRPWIEPEKYYNLPKEERYKYRTDKTEGHKHYGVCGFKAKDILAYHDIVIDMDNHIPSADPACVQRTLDKIAELIEQADGEGFTRPSFVVKTGRGLQLHYRINPVYAGATALVKLAAKALVGYWQFLMQKFDAQFGGNGTYTSLEVDVKASMNVGGYKRLAGTFNWSTVDAKTGKWGYMTRAVCINDSVYDVLMLIDSLHEYLPERDWKKHCWVQEQKAKRAEEERMAKLFVNADGTPYVPVRPEKKKKKHYAAKFRHQDGKYENSVYDNPARTQAWLKVANEMMPEIVEGHRNNALFAIGCILRDGGVDVDAEIPNMNSRFSTPLDEHEVDRVVKSVNSGVHHFSNARAVEWCGLTFDQVKPYGIGEGGRRMTSEERSKMRAKKREARDKEILHQVHSTGSISAAARTTCHCRALVRKVLAHFRNAIAEIRVRNENNATNLRRFKNALIDVAYFWSDRLRPQIFGYDTRLFIDAPLTS